MDTADKIYEHLEPLQRQLAVWRLKDKRVVFTNGCFDLLHVGHVTYLEAARSLGDVLIIGLNTDESVSRLKGPARPLNTLSARARVLGALACVDAVVPFAEDTPLNLIRQLRPDVLAKGADYALEDIVGAEVVQGYGGEVVRIPLVEGVSTTSTIAKMQANKG